MRPNILFIHFVRLRLTIHKCNFSLHKNKLSFDEKTEKKRIYFMHRLRDKERNREWVTNSIASFALHSYHSSSWNCMHKHNKFSPFIYNDISLNAINLIKLLPLDAVQPLWRIAYIIVFIYIHVYVFCMSDAFSLFLFLSFPTFQLASISPFEFCPSNLNT